MHHRVFLAGATGVIGRRLTLLLRNAGHEVIGTTRSQSKAAALGTLGAVPAVVDVFDAKALALAVAHAQPTVVIHQLTDLPDEPDPKKIEAALARNAMLRVEGTRNLVEAARHAGIRRVIAQSVAFAYAPGAGPRRESDPLDTGNAARKTTIDGVVALEKLVTATWGIDGLVLRYGRLYGPGTWTETPSGSGPLHVDAAAQAALLALERGKSGIYNIAEDDGSVSIEKAQRELAFDPAFRLAETP